MTLPTQSTRMTVMTRMMWKRSDLAHLYEELRVLPGAGGAAMAVSDAIDALDRAIRACPTPEQERRNG